MVVKAPLLNACSWLRYLSAPDSPLPEHLRANVRVAFVVAAQAAPGQQEAWDVQDEAAQYGDILFVDAPEGYENLWRKALVFLQWLEASSGMQYDYAMHADDDSFIRLDLLLPLMAGWPRERWYWGYIWDGTGNRVTQPIRNPSFKSHMPASQYPLDYYPPFASGCGFVLSRNLVRALLAQPLPDYRLLDPPFGIHLAGRDMCVLAEPVEPVHAEQVRPFRAFPIFKHDTLVQHYLQPEEMKPFYEQALQAARGSLEPAADAHAGGDVGMDAPQGAPEQLYNTLVAMGVLRRSCTAHGGAAWSRGLLPRGASR